MSSSLRIQRRISPRRGVCWTFTNVSFPDGWQRLREAKKLAQGHIADKLPWLFGTILGLPAGLSPATLPDTNGWIWFPVSAWPTGTRLFLSLHKEGDRVKIVNVSPPYREKAGNRALHSMANTVDGCPLSPSVPYKPSCVRVCSRVCARMCTQLCPTLCDPMDCSLRGSSVHGILQARILQWVAISSSGGSFWPRDWTHISCVSFTGRRILYLAFPSEFTFKSPHASPTHIIYSSTLIPIRW